MSNVEVGILPNTNATRKHPHERFSLRDNRRTGRFHWKNNSSTNSTSIRHEEKMPLPTGLGFEPQQAAFAV